MKWLMGFVWSVRGVPRTSPTVNLSRSGYNLRFLAISHSFKNSFLKSYTLIFLSTLGSEQITSSLRSLIVIFKDII